MEYYKKYRPQSFDQVVGNAGLINGLKANLATGTVPHTILFSGSAGCGKTTLARILAKELNCSEADCVETNTANFRGIDSARDIIVQMAYAPRDGDARVWIMDEVHKTTSDAWDALLKPLEDTPAHVYFILCSTNPEKIPKPILSRCRRYEVESLTPAEIGSGILVPVCKAEGIRPPVEILKQIAKECMGSGRIALVTLEMIAHLPPEQMAEAARVMITRESKTNELCQLLLKPSKDWKTAAEILKGLTEEPETIRRGVMGYMNVVLLNSGNARAYDIMACFEKDYFTSGKVGLTMSVYDAMFGGK